MSEALNEDAAQYGDVSLNVEVGEITIRLPAEYRKLLLAYPADRDRLLTALMREITHYFGVDARGLPIIPEYMGRLRTAAADG